MRIYTMIDLETIGTKPNSVVLSLGACIFDVDKIHSEFYKPINAESQMRAGRKADFGTLCWWLAQGEDAKRVFEESKNAQSALETIKEFHTWCQANAGADTLVLSNGIDFDVQIMENIYDALGLSSYPWKYFNKRCYRTVKTLFKIEENEKREGTKHHALFDALFQAKCYQKFLRQFPQFDR